MSGILYPGNRSLRVRVLHLARMWGEYEDKRIMTKKAPNPIEKHVVSRVRMRRTMVGMSQERLGDVVAMSFQQCQKYEKGTSRIGASRLQQIAQILQVPVAFFFEGAPLLPEGAAPEGLQEAPSPA